MVGEDATVGKIESFERVRGFLFGALHRLSDLVGGNRNAGFVQLNTIELPRNLDEGGIAAGSDILDNARDDAVDFLGDFAFFGEQGCKRLVEIRIGVF